MNSIEIPRRTKVEHRNLLNKIYEGFKISESLPSKVVFTDPLQHFEMDFLRMFNEQQKSLARAIPPGF